MGVSKNRDIPKSSILIRVSNKIIHFGVPLFLETSIYHRWKSDLNLPSYLLAGDMM